MLVVLGDLRSLAAVDRDRGAVIPSRAVRRCTRSYGAEDEVKRLLKVTDHLALAPVVVLGHPVRQPTRLRRATVPEFATFDTYDGAPVGADTATKPRIRASRLPTCSYRVLVEQCRRAARFRALRPATPSVSSTRSASS
jgi:hypothetical protein